MNDIPPDLKYSVSDKKNHDFYNAVLHIYYYASLLMIHRFDRSVRFSSSSAAGDSIPCQAALRIAGIVHNLVVFEEVAQCPPYLPYCIFWAMIVLLRQSRSPSTRIARRTKSGFETCMVAMSQVSSTWEFGSRIFKLFEQFLDERRKSEERETGSENSRPDCRPAQKHLLAFDFRQENDYSHGPALVSPSLASQVSPNRHGTLGALQQSELFPDDLDYLADWSPLPYYDKIGSTSSLEYDGVSDDVNTLKSGPSESVISFGLGVDEWYQRLFDNKEI
jgi:hypothetical protein